MILVTGATGNVGSELVPLLLGQGFTVRALTRDARKLSTFGSTVEAIEGDFDAPKTISAAMAGIDKLFLMIGGIGHNHASVAVEAAKTAGVKSIVLLSSLVADVQEIAIGRWHTEREALVRSSGIPHTILRPGGFMSNALQWAGSVKAQGVVYLPGGETRSSPIDPYDIAAVAAAALTNDTHAGKTYELTGGEVLTSTEMVDTLAKVLDRPIKCIAVPPAAARERMSATGMPVELVDAILESLEYVRGGLESHVVPTVERLLARPPRTFATWCQNHAAAYQTG